VWFWFFASAFLWLALIANLLKRLAPHGLPDLS
jgi:hypothetical protein